MFDVNFVNHLFFCLFLDATGTIISTVVDRIDVQLAIAFWFNQSNFEHIMLSLCAPFTQSVIYVVAAAIFEIAIVCVSLVLGRLIFATKMTFFRNPQFLFHCTSSFSL